MYRWFLLYTSQIIQDPKTYKTGSKTNTMLYTSQIIQDPKTYRNYNTSFIN